MGDANAAVESITDAPQDRLVAGVKAADPAACGQLYDLFGHRLHRYIAVRLPGDDQLAEELMLLTLAEAAQRIRSFNPREANSLRMVVRCRASSRPAGVARPEPTQVSPGIGAGSPGGCARASRPGGHCGFRRSASACAADGHKTQALPHRYRDGGANPSLHAPAIGKGDRKGAGTIRASHRFASASGPAEGPRKAGTR